MRYELRSAERSDVAAIAAIWHAGLIDGHLGRVDQRLVEARTPDSFLDRAAQRLDHTTVAAGVTGLLSEEVAGFVTVIDNEVEKIYVGAPHRGSGCATKLLGAAESQITQAGHRLAWLAVVAGNDTARRFYAKHGWRDRGTMTYPAESERAADTRIAVEAHRYEKQLVDVPRRHRTSLLSSSSRGTSTSMKRRPDPAAECPTMTIAAWAGLTEQERRAVQSLQITESQVDYAGTTESAVALAAASDGDNLVGLAILDDSIVVGFLLLKRSTAAPDWVPANAAVVSALRIDLAHQSKGIGRCALRQLPRWVRTTWPTVEQLVLSVDDDNAAAIRAYTYAGWNDTGERTHGRVGPERRMTLPLTPSDDR